MAGNLTVCPILDNCGQPTLASLIGNALYITVFTVIDQFPFINVILSWVIFKVIMSVAGISSATLLVSSLS